MHSLVIRDGDHDRVDSEERGRIGLLERERERGKPILDQADDGDGLDGGVDLCDDGHDGVRCRDGDVDGRVRTWRGPDIEGKSCRLRRSARDSQINMFQTLIDS